MDKFKVGDRVKCINPNDYKENTGGFDNHSTYLLGETGNGMFEVRNNRGHCHIMSQDYLKKNFAKTKEVPVSKYERLAQEISEVTGWDKKADDIMQELSKGESRVIEITCYNRLSGFIAIHEAGCLTGTREEMFNYKTQCEKNDAFKQALMWLLDHSDIKKDIVGQEVRADIEGKIYKVKVLEVI